MNTIAMEQKKLQMIQQKQQELNSIMTKQLNVSTTAKNTNSVNGVNGVNGGGNSNLIINNSKRTKKNEEAIVQNIKINSNKPPEIIKKNKIDNADRIILDEEADDKKETDKKETTKEKKKESNEPYKYHSKKEKPDVIWPSKNDLYKSDTYQNNLTICNGIQPFFTISQNKKGNKFDNDIEQMKKVMKTEFEIKKIDRFNDNAIKVMYNILKYDKIYLKE